MKCVYGKMYRMDCNTCHCGHRNTLLCTKEACLVPMKSEINGEAEKPVIKVQKMTKLEFLSNNTMERKKKIKRIIRRGSKRELRTDTGGLPPLPPSRICLPGRIYQEECKRCYCRANRQPTCSASNACSPPKVVRDLVPEDVRPKVKDKEFRNLPTLPHTASPCAPGTTYKVECNVCVCDEFQNLMCDKMMCISFADMHRQEALKKTGLPCNSNNYQENEVMQSKCVQCACNGTTYCEAKEDCMSETEYIMRSAFATRRNGSPLAFDFEREKCQPDHIYKDNCNKCYCQEDGTLRCTQKVCLNHSEAVVLEKEHQYLEEHGL